MNTHERIRALCNDVSRPAWFRNALASAARQNPIDAARDAALLAELTTLLAADEGVPAKPQYVVVNDTGEAYGIRGDLTAGDLSFAEHGLRTIVRLSDLHYFGRQRAWLPLAASEVSHVVETDEDLPPAHFPIEQRG